MDDPPFPKARDVLLNHLNCKIKYIQPDLAEKILPTVTHDKSNQELIELLMNDSLLEEKVNTIALLIDHDKRETLGAKLFQSVCKIEQELSAQVTGMLLELPISVINSLLTNPKDLKKAVSKAKGEFLAYLKNAQQPEEVVCFLPDGAARSLGGGLPLSKEDLGERVYEKLASTYPDVAPKLTGMLLQMPGLELEALLADEQLMKDKVQEALTALERDLKEGSPSDNSTGTGFIA